MTAGRDTRTWRRLKAEVYARLAPCCRCHQPIDYTLPYRDPATGRVDNRSKSVDHYPHPLTTHPHLAESLDNLAAAHLGCNASAQHRDTDATLGLGTATRTW